jgi:hypothetical protein
MTGDRRARVRRAYERGRWVRAAPWGAPAAALAAVGWAGGAAWALWIGPALAAALIVAAWRGGAVARGAEAGFLAGLIPCAAVGVLQLTGSCGPVPCLATCGLAGVAVAGALSPGLRREPAPWGAAAVGVAALAGAIPCLALGAAGLALVPALLGTAVPVRLLRRV